MPAFNQHPWLDRAIADLGVVAIPGQATSARVHDYYAAAGHPDIAGDDVAWCAAFVGAWLERVGVTSTRSLLARSYLAWGQPTDVAHPGTIAIFSRGSDPALGHVGFAVGESGDSIYLLGGNQSDAVSVIAMPRAHLLGMRWPSDSPVQSAPPETAPSVAFEFAVQHVLAMEGGFSDDPYDPGGPTNLGITLADLASYRGIAIDAQSTPALRSAVAALKPADVQPIYRTRYWEPSDAPSLPAALALFHFDAAVNHGIGTAARMLQQSLSVDVDAEIGPVTLAAAHDCDLADTLDTYAEIRRARYRALSTFWRFGRGWLRRVDLTLAAARRLLPASSPTVSPATNPTHQEPAMTTTATPITTPIASDQNQPKWWGQSLTLWGTVVTTLSTVLPIVGPLLGISISADVVHQLGDGLVQVVQAIGGVVGIVMTIYGRTRAVQPLVRRDFMVKL